MNTALGILLFVFWRVDATRGNPVIKDEIRRLYHVGRRYWHRTNAQ